MKGLLIALALLTTSCAPTVAPAPLPDERSSERGVAPNGYTQFCQDEPHSQLCK